MSLPPAPMPMGLMSAPNAVINPLETFFMSINTNPYFIGIMMLLLNMGGRFLPMEISKEQEKILQNPWVRKVLIFVVLFVATRNVFVALIGSIIILLFVSYLLNENSSLCLWKMAESKPTKESAVTGSSDAAPVPSLTPEEADILRRLNEKQLRMSAAAATAAGKSKEGQTDEEIPMEDIYAFNLNRLRA